MCLTKTKETKLLTRAASGIVPLEYEVSTPADTERACLQVLQLREDEFQRAVGICATGGDVKAEDRADVVRGEDSIVLRAKRLVRL